MLGIYVGLYMYHQPPIPTTSISMAKLVAIISQNKTNTNHELEASIAPRLNLSLSLMKSMCKKNKGTGKRLTDLNKDSEALGASNQQESKACSAAHKHSRICAHVLLTPI